MLMENIRFDGKRLFILDQTRLPNEEKYIEMTSLEDCFFAIKLLQVRGAPAIGIFAGYALALFHGNNIEKAKEYLDSSRPTAVNLSWATARILDAHKDGDGILTHCNAGELATSKYGTGLGPLILGKEKGYTFHVFSDETRPLLQGARLTSYELEKAGIDVTLICDNMASLVMKKGLINAVLVGCDRVAANGDTANKIGTSGAAILAKHYGIPFYVLGPYSTVDFSTKTGDDIIIEEREAEEIKTMFYENPTALPQTKCFNPAFDVTDNNLITAIITDKGIAYPPFSKSLKELLK